MDFFPRFNLIALGGGRMFYIYLGTYISGHTPYQIKTFTYLPYGFPCLDLRVSRLYLVCITT